MALISVFIISIFLTIVLTPLFVRLADRYNAYDLPDERKLHGLPVPHVGGIIMAIGAFVPIFTYINLEIAVRAYLAGALVILIFGLLDDFKGLDFRIKFAGQIIAALIAVFYGGIKITKTGTLLPGEVVLVPWLAVSLTVIFMVGVTNAINMTDGLDGLAAGICLLIFLFIAYLARLEGETNIVIIAVALSGAIIGFLRFNTHPATLFMGDAGSQLLGYSAAYLSISLTQQADSRLSPLLPLIILGFPILDTITVMFSRLAAGRSPFSADLNHFHHRLVRMGLFHTEAVFAIYVIQAFLIVSAFNLRFCSEWALFISYLSFSGLTLAAFFAAEVTGWKLRRFAFISRVKGKMRLWREKGLGVKIVHKLIEFGAPLILIANNFMPARMPGVLAASSAVSIVIFIGVWLFRRDLAKVFLVMLVYLHLPFFLYVSEANLDFWMQDTLRPAHTLLIGFVAALSFLSIYLTRRKGGFKITPRDFLVLFVAFMVLTLQDLRYEFGAVAIKTVVLFFIYEILLGEARKEIGRVAILTLVAFAVAVLRGI